MSVAVLFELYLALISWLIYRNNLFVRFLLWINFRSVNNADFQNHNAVRISHAYHTNYKPTILSL